MTAVTVLTAAKINHRRVERRLVRAGYATVAEEAGLRVSRHGRWDVATMTTSAVADLPRDTLDAAQRLLGLPPRTGVTCRFEGAVGTSDSWPTVVDIARAVAAVAPLAVLNDHAGTTYLVHLVRGLIGPEEYEPALARRRPSTADFLRKLMGG
jgi:hypothetical protein